MNLILKKKEGMVGRRSNKRALPLVVLRSAQSNIRSSTVLLILFIVGMFWMVPTSRVIYSPCIINPTIPTTPLQHPGTTTTTTTTMSFQHEIDTTNNSNENHHYHLSPPPPKKKKNPIFSFHRQPSTVIQNYVSCVLDSKCHVMYLHVSKTGGSTMEHILGKIHSTNIKSMIEINEFTDVPPSTFCNLPILSSQESATKFMKIIVPTCQQYLFQTKSNTHRNIILVTIREPIARTLSQIHQLCNKNMYKRGMEILAICRKCNFDTDENFWMRKAKGTNKIYQALMDYVFYSKDETIFLKNTTTPTLLVDMDDMDNFFLQLKHALPQSYERYFKDDTIFSNLIPESIQSLFSSNKNDDTSSSNNSNTTTTKLLKNPEQISICSFSMNSQMIKALIPSSKIYRNLTLMMN